MELLIVVAIIGILAAIAIPNLMHSKQSACSASAVSSLRLIHSSQSTYRTSYGQYGTLTALGQEYFINDLALRGGHKSKYLFAVTPDAAQPAVTYTATAAPDEPTAAAIWRHYFVDATGVIRWKAAAPATASDNPID